MEPLFFSLMALLIGAGTRYFLRKTSIPYTVLLLIFGIGLGLLVRFNIFKSNDVSFWHTFSESISWAGQIDPQVILFGFLPILVFEAAFGMDIHTFKKTVVNASVLAIPGILLAIFFTALLVKGLDGANIGFANWGWALAFLFGAVISATDPVAVVAILKDLGISKKLSTLIEGESLLNDGTAIVFFFVFAALLPFELFQTSHHSVLYEFFKVSLGGIFLGWIIGISTLMWVKRVYNDAIIAITLIVVAAYLTFYIAEHFLHVSGVLGLVSLGLYMASAGRTRINADVQHFLHEFWELAAFVANTLIFIIVGVVIAERTVFKASDFLSLILLYVGIHIIRAIMIILFYPIMKKTGYGLSGKDAIILGYGGLRGAIGLSLALIFEGQIEKLKNVNSEMINQANQLLFYTAGIVVFTSLINATTIKIIIKKLGMNVVPPIKIIVLSNVFRDIDKSISDEIEVLQNDRFMNGADWKQVKNHLSAHNNPLLSDSDTAKIDPYAEVRRRILEKEKASYWNQFKEGLLSPRAYTKLTDNIKEEIDKAGSKSLSDRDYLESTWLVPKIWPGFQLMPLTRRWARKTLLEKLAVSYDTARGFVIAQEEISRLAGSMNYTFSHRNILLADSALLSKTIQEEIDINRLKGLNVISELHITYPEISIAIETRQATRSILNFERNSIIKLEKEGKLEEDEATALLADIGIRMKKLMSISVILNLPEPLEILEHLSWLSDSNIDTVKKVKSIAILKSYNSGQMLMQEGENGERGMLVIARGAVKVIVKDKIIDILCAGNVIGEMSVLAGGDRTATVIANTPVTVLWFSEKDIKHILNTSEELEQALWQMAGLRFAENLLGKEEPYISWPQIKLRRWLSTGEVLKIKKYEQLKLYNQIAVLLTGTANDKETDHEFIAPSLITSPEIILQGNVHVFVVSNINV